MREIETFIAAHRRRHPELDRQILWPDVRRMAAREGVRIRHVPLSRPGRLVGFGERWEIQISDALPPNERTVVGMHELIHYWRDRAGEPAFYASEDWLPDPREDFANLAAWYLTSPARPVQVR